MGIRSGNGNMKLLMGMLLLLTAWLQLDSALGSIHEVHGRSTGCRFTERMYADGHGPFGLGGRSNVSLSAAIKPLHDEDVLDSITIHRLREYFSFGVVAVTYSDGDRWSELDERSVCAHNFSDPDEGNVDGVLHGEFHELADDATSLNISTEFHPKRSGLQIVLVVLCWKQKSESFGYPVSTTEFSKYPMVDPVLSMDVSVSFRNPYGYLPALLYGLFPFNGVLSLLYGILDVGFVAMINRHRKSAMGIHYVLLSVLLLATGEAVAWFVTYKVLNETGQTVCCPYPGILLFATIAKILSGMLLRIATTLLCLGYGVVRRSLAWPEILLVAGLGLCYFIAVGALEITHILNQSQGDVRPPIVWELLVVVTNLCFGGWIFTSLGLTRKNLAHFGQTAKLAMYTSLHRVLIAYVLISLFLMGMEGAVYSGSVVMDWQWIWLIWAGNRLLTFVILLVVTVIWRPTSNSRLYAQMDQIPSRSPSSTRGIEMMPRQVPSAADEDTSPTGAKNSRDGTNQLVSL